MSSKAATALPLAMRSTTPRNSIVLRAIRSFGQRVNVSQKLSLYRQKDGNGVGAALVGDIVGFPRPGVGRVVGAVGFGEGTMVGGSAIETS